MRAVILSVVVLAGCATSNDDESWNTIDQEVSVASFTYAPAQVQVGVPITFDASSTTCGGTTCSYRWQWWFPHIAGGVFNGWHIGGQMGFGQVVSYTFDAFAASKPYVLVTVGVTESPGPRLKPVYSAQQSFVVAP